MRLHVASVSTVGGQLIGLLHEPRVVRTTIHLDPDESLLLYTDGLVEARTPDGDMLGQERLARHLAAGGVPSAEHLLHTVDGLLGGLGPGAGDDTALLALSVPLPPASPHQEKR
ncbi:SpoIIE family protein phosphatase [Streptomyces sp. NPDC058294]|uniref:SpoIIE family protein phosphatase n=1 Tax=Streptomyces sp. NPDC058294 TaxID=3346430 RepID=UPI0036E63FA9